MVINIANIFQKRFATSNEGDYQRLNMKIYMKKLYCLYDLFIKYNTLFIEKLNKTKKHGIIPYYTAVNVLSIYIIIVHYI